MKAYLKIFPTILVGNALLAFSVCAFIVPHDLMLGGCTGIALALQQVIDLPLSILSAILNSFFFFLGLAFLGKQFAASSILSTILYPLLLAVCEQLPLAEILEGDLFISSVFGGIGMGAGIGLVVRAGGSTGGMDIPPCILQKYKGIPVGISLMAFDILIVLTLQLGLHHLNFPHHRPPHRNRRTQTAAHHHFRSVPPNPAGDSADPRFWSYPTRYRNRLRCPKPKSPAGGDLRQKISRHQRSGFIHRSQRLHHRLRGNRRQRPRLHPAAPNPCPLISNHFDKTKALPGFAPAAQLKSPRTSFCFAKWRKERKGFYFYVVFRDRCSCLFSLLSKFTSGRIIRPAARLLMPWITSKGRPDTIQARVCSKLKPNNRA